MNAPRMLTYKGVTKPMRQWASETGVSRELIAYRLRTGWTVEEALETPATGKRKKQTYICPYPLDYEDCDVSSSFSYCCAECYKRRHCKVRCLNSPTKCGALII